MDKTKNIREQFVSGLIKDQMKKIDPKNLYRSRYIEGSIQVSHSLKELLKNKKHLFRNWNTAHAIQQDPADNLPHLLEETAKFDVKDSA